MDTSWPSFPISPHARQSYQEIAEGSPPLDPPEFPPPQIHPAARNVPCSVQDFGTGTPREESVYLIRDSPSANHAYRLIPRQVKRPVPIERCGQRWGEVLFCVCLLRISADREGGGGINNLPTFAEPDPSSSDCVVAIKKLRKAVFVPFIEQGCPENPYKEISAMQQIADNIHVLGCIEALEDDKYLYTVMPLCDGGELFDIIHQQRESGVESTLTSTALPEPQARTYFRQILECVNYLHNTGLSHLDISPENIMIKGGRCILIDLGCTLPVPTAVSGNGRRSLLRPRPRPFGKIPYLPFEVPRGRPFDGFAVDLWSLGITLFHMCVGQTIGGSAAWVTVYESLLSFISNSPHMQHITRNQNGVVINLLDQILRGDPATRTNLDGVIRSLWVASSAIPYVPIEHYLE